MSLTNASPETAARIAKAASHTLATLVVDQRNDALTAIHATLAAHKDEVLAANAEDLAQARKAAETGELNASLISRLDLGRKGKWEDMLAGILDVRALPDPVGRVDLRTRLDVGLELERVSCPIGVLLVIFEARPEVIANVASLAIKSGNAAILKGGKESTQSFIAISRLISQALNSTAVPNDAIQLVTTRDVIPALLAQDQHIDLVIPRGSNELVRSIKSSTRIPVLGHADGLCTIYLEDDVDASLASRVIVDSKTSYPAACNSVETLLVAPSALSTILPVVAAALIDSKVQLRCDQAVFDALQPHHPSSALLIHLDPTTDFTTEHLAPVLTVAQIPSLADAIEHINTYGSHHTDAILTNIPERAEHFLAAVDSANVYWNASTRMADGTRYGFGTEVGISTNKIHARGPVGLQGLTIYKYKLRGRGQTSLEYGGVSGKPFLHEQMPL